MLKLPKRFHPDFSRPDVKPTGPVEIDWGNPLTNKIGRGEIFGVFNGGFNPLVRKYQTFTVSSNATIVGSNKGQGIQGAYVASDGVYIDSTDFTTHGWASITYLAVAYSTGSGGANERPFFRETNVTGNGATVSYVTTGNNLRALINTTGTSIWTGTKDSAINTTPGWYVFGMTWDGINRKMWQIPIGGRGTFLRSDACTGTINIASGTGTKKFVIQGGVPTNAYGEPNPFIFNICFEGCFTDAEVNAFARDPYQILKPANDIYYFTPTGAGSTYTLTADPGVFALAGESVTFTAQRKLTADVGAYTLSGDNVTFSTTTSYTLAADVGAYSLAGDSVLFTAQHKILADVSAYTLSGDGVTFTYTPGQTLSADVGSYTIGGGSVTFRADRLLTADVSAYVFTGGSATFTIDILSTPECAIYLNSKLTAAHFLTSYIDDNGEFYESVISGAPFFIESDINETILFLEGDVC